MGTLSLRAILSCLLTVVLTGSAFAADSTSAMLYTNGPSWLNGSSVSKTSAIFSGALVQTRSDSVANIKAPGTSVLVLSDQGSAVKLEPGVLNVLTSKSMTAQVGGLKVIPVAASWTEFEVRDTDGSVKIIAREGDLTLTDASGMTTLPQGQETTATRLRRTGRRSVTATRAAPHRQPAVAFWILRPRFTMASPPWVYSPVGLSPGETIPCAINSVNLSSTLAAIPN